MNEIPLSLYIHFPWCKKKCPYCDFNSYAFENNSQIKSKYIQSIVEDLKSDSYFVNNRKLSSIFLGGGTPTLFSATEIIFVLEKVKLLTPFDKNIEISIEANPGAISIYQLKALRDYGVNRISIGIQSFQDEKLNSLGRIHSSDDAKKAVDIARNSGFENINLDIIYGLPNQTVRDALSDLKIAISLGVQHISWYELTIENNTQFFNAPPTSLPDELTMDAIECEGINLLNNSGFARYEISAFSKFGFMCKHNLNYWMFGDYIGLGAGAHGKTTNPISQEITRYSKIADPSQYILCKNNFKKAYDDISVIQKNNIPFEFMLNAMRLVNGFSIDLFLYRTGLSINYIKKQLDQLTNQNMIVVKNGFVKPTSLGTKYLNDALLLFLRD